MNATKLEYAFSIASPEICVQYLFMFIVLSINIRVFQTVMNSSGMLGYLVWTHVK